MKPLMLLAFSNILLSSFSRLSAPRREVFLMPKSDTSSSLFSLFLPFYSPTAFTVGSQTCGPQTCEPRFHLDIFNSNSTQDGIFCGYSGEKDIECGCSVVPNEYPGDTRWVGEGVGGDSVPCEAFVPCSCVRGIYIYDRAHKHKNKPVASGVFSC